jgi:hypothetical protein
MGATITSSIAALLLVLNIQMQNAGYIPEKNKNKNKIFTRVATVIGSGRKEQVGGARVRRIRHPRSIPIPTSTNPPPRPVQSSNPIQFHRRIHILLPLPPRAATQPAPLLDPEIPPGSLRSCAEFRYVLLPSHPALSSRECGCAPALSVDSVSFADCPRPDSAVAFRSFRFGLSARGILDPIRISPCKHPRTRRPLLQAGIQLRAARS